MSNEPKPIEPNNVDDLETWLNARLEGREERTDALIGEIVRFLVRADAAAFARIYAVVKTESAAMNKRFTEEFRQRRIKP